MTTNHRKCDHRHCNDPEWRNLDNTPAGRRWQMRRDVIDGDGDPPAQPELPLRFEVIDGGKA
jgi:hypothetical protein